METDADLDERVDVRADPSAVAPPVVAVVVAHDPGDWFEACLGSLATQDYPSLSILVVDAGSATPVAPRVAAVLPSAFVRRIDGNPGVGAASNEVLGIVEGAAFYLLCHDDIALEPGAVRALVEEAFRSNAGIVGPKLVAWDDTNRLLQVGVLVDKTGHEHPTVERGELDQEQHDAVRDVFCVPGAVTLVRSDLFASLGGYDPAITFLGEDLDLCWRAQVAGARVLIAPAATARHLEALGMRDGFDVATRRRLTLRHRLRAVLTCYGRWHRLRVVPQVAILTLVESVYALLAGRRQLAADAVGAWRWNRRHRAEMRAAHAKVQATRALPDSEVRRLQAHGSARLAAFLRGQLGRGGDDRVRALTRSAGDVAGSLRKGPLRTAAAVWGVIVLVVVIGSRHHLWSTPPPSLVDLPQLPLRPWPVLGEWLSGWRNSGLGSESPQPTAFGLLGFAGTALVGSMTLLRRIIVVGPLLLGPLGAARLARRTGSRRAALVAAVAYAAIPVPYNAIAEGRWGGAVVWSFTPWLVSAVARAGGDAPFDDAADRSPAWRSILGLGLVTAVIGAFVPLAVALPVVLAVALAIGGLAAGHGGGAARMVGTAVAATGVAVALHVPWSLDLVLPGATWASIGGAASSVEAPSLVDLLRFHTGPTGAGPLAWAPLVAAVLPLVIGRAWRLTWAVRAWALALVGWALAVLAGAASLDVGTGPLELALAPAACGLAFATALGVAAFEVDLPGYRFGWRQVASGVAAAALAVGTLPVLGASLDGNWSAPDHGVTDVLAFLDSEQESAGPFRTLWLGDPAVLPLAGWQLEEGLAWGLTDDGVPDVLDRSIGSLDNTTRLVADAVELATAGETSRLGRQLAPMGVRYVVVVQADRPVAGPQVPAPDDLVAALPQQLDLAEVDVDDSLRVFRNAAWLPTRAAVASADELVEPRDQPDATPVLTNRDEVNRYEGEVPDGAVWTSTKSSSRWQLSVDGRDASPFEGFGWGNAYLVEEGGPAHFEYSTPLSRHAVYGLQAAAWVVVAYVLLRTRRRRTEVEP